MDKKEIIKSKGVYSSIDYLILMTIAYSSQIFKLFETKQTAGLSLLWIVCGLIAVLLRILTNGFAILEAWKKAKIKSVANYALALAELVVVIGLIIILIQFLLIEYF